MKRLNSIILLLSGFFISITLPALLIFLLNKSEEHIAPLYVSVFFLFSVFFSYIFGKLSDILNNRRYFIIFGEFFAAVVYLIMYFNTNFIILLISSALIGIAQSAYSPLLIALFSELEFKMKRGKLSGLINTMSSLGWAFGSIIGGFIEQILGLDMVFIFASVIAVIGAVPLFFLKIDRKKLYEEIKAYQNSLKNQAMRDTIFVGNNITISNDNNHNNNHKNYMNIMLIIMIAISLRFICSQGAVAGLLPNFLKYELGATPIQKGLILSINNTFQCVMMLPLGLLMEKTGRKWIFVLGIFGSGLNSLFYSFASDPMHVIPNQFLIGVSYAAIATSSTAIVIDISKFQDYGKGLGLLNGARSIGGILGPFFAIFFILISYQFAFLMLTIFGIIGALFLACLLIEDKRSTNYYIRFITTPKKRH